MPASTLITTQQFSKLIGLPNGPAIVDVRIDDDYRGDPRLLPGSHAPRLSCHRKLGAGLSGQERRRRLPAWAKAERRHGRLAAPRRHRQRRRLKAVSKPGRRPTSRWSAPTSCRRATTKGRTVWVTRSRPKVDRIACPWLIRRFIDPSAVFLFVSPSEVTAVAERFNATPFDIDDVFWSHRGETCTFDTMIEEFDLKTAPLLQLAKIVRGADTARPDLTPQSAGLLAASLGYSRMYRDDLPQLEAAMGFYDAMYRWCRDATSETHNWPSTKPGA